MALRLPVPVALGGLAALLAGLVACSSTETPPPAPVAAPAEAAPAEMATATTPGPALLMVQAHFDKSGGGLKPLPAKMVIVRKSGDQWQREEITDPEANVFHKAIAWRDGILTIGAEIAPKPATLKLWTKQGGTWTGKTLWSRAFDGSKFNRFRDLEIGDVTGDGKEDLVLATHDAGVVAVGQEGADGTWTFTEMDARPDTFVHEIEIGDVDGDGKAEFYATPSPRNRASGTSQPGAVVRYDWKDGAFVKTTVVDFTTSHAKEILVDDVDGDGRDELYVVREAEVVAKPGQEGKDDPETERKDPVRIFRFDLWNGKWTGTTAATLEDEQTRFLVPGDLDGDGKKELVAAGYHSGLWELVPKGDGTFEPTQIDADSGGFEHATHVADLDGDGKLEIYVAADTQKELRRYVWNAETRKFDRTSLGAIGPADRSHITWNLQDGRL
jgi:hypothetical protein